MYSYSCDFFLVLGPLGYLLGASLDSLGVSWVFFDASWGLLRTSWRPLGASWGAPGTLWKLLVEAPWGPLGSILGTPGSLLESHGRSFGGIIKFYIFVINLGNERKRVPKKEAFASLTPYLQLTYYFITCQLIYDWIVGEL